eukprot:CAMPEP_0204343186 /NCGR_PEP_ID=MMETSP0469-20131031/24714_1 /ASSEMBLY_ACC=CAM_ASM_000384 /TAXON_ID=2969 /ORGANISM="Oxyrrhis marina" /LENGTH=35 /DNA_ID= /DNA_START= /DNA_END= /DNA_ORIENTATION=
MVYGTTTGGRDDEGPGSKPRDDTEGVLSSEASACA